MPDEDGDEGVGGAEGVGAAPGVDLDERKEGSVSCQTGQAFNCSSSKSFIRQEIIRSFCHRCVQKVRPSLKN